MLKPDQVEKEAKKKEKINLKFKNYLKNHADEDELDAQFLALHNELFKDYDCSQCRNCCKMYHGSIPEDDLEEDAKYLGITKEQFIEFFLQKEDYSLSYSTKHKPCDFLCEDGSCRLGDCKPESCKNYPYTNQPERIWSLYSVLNVVGVCPVAFEIYERLKKIYHFR